MPVNKKIGRRGKYTPELVQIICDAIAATGSDKAGVKTAQISTETFYVWMAQHPDFSERVIAAREQYRAACPEALIAGCNRAIAQYLSGTATRTSITKKSRIHPEKPKLDFEETTETITKLNVPPWVIDRVLGPVMDEAQAIRVLVRAGYLPNDVLELTGEQFNQLRQSLKNIFTGILPDIQHKGQAGLTEETAAAIRREILGDFSQNLPALPSEVDAGQEPR